MTSIAGYDVNKDSDSHPEISQLVRAISQADPLSVAEGVQHGVPYVIISGNNKHFRFDKTAEGYTLKASDFKGTN
jgi:hypothetical protein